MRKVPLAWLALMPLQVQDVPERFMFEAGIVGGNALACPGHYVAINGRVGEPVSLYGMVETYRCADLAGSASVRPLVLFQMGGYVSF